LWSRRGRRRSGRGRRRGRDLFLVLDLTCCGGLEIEKGKEWTFLGQPSNQDLVGMV